MSLVVLDNSLNRLWQQVNRPALFAELAALIDRARDIHLGQATARGDEAPLTHALLEIASGHSDRARMEFALPLDDRSLRFDAQIARMPADASGSATDLLVISFSDLSVMDEVKSQLVHSAKLASIGAMAAGMAHELNQPLNVIRMSSQNLLRAIDRDTLTPASARQKLDRISAQVDRAAKLISSLKTFGRKTNLEAQYIDPRATVDAAVSILREQIALQSVVLEHQGNAPECHVLADPTALEQVVINLINNARDAIREHQIEAGRIQVIESTDADSYRIVVQDNGGGIPDHIREQIFDPFFTTKEVGRGTGLGLSISYGILHEVGGDIVVTNADGGARFEVSLPLAG